MSTLRPPDRGDGSPAQAGRRGPASAPGEIHGRPCYPRRAHFSERAADAADSAPASRSVFHRPHATQTSSSSISRGVDPGRPRTSGRSPVGTPSRPASPFRAAADSGGSRTYAAPPPGPPERQPDRLVARREHPRPQRVQCFGGRQVAEGDIKISTFNVPSRLRSGHPHPASAILAAVGRTRRPLPCFGSSGASRVAIQCGNWAQSRRRRCRKG
jgi:hypothetical protein